MMGFALVNMSSYATKDSIPDTLDGMVRIRRRRMNDVVIRIEDIERAAQAMLVDEDADPAEAEYLLNNVVDGYHYWNFY